MHLSPDFIGVCVCACVQQDTEPDMGNLNSLKQFNYEYNSNLN